MVKLYASIPVSPLKSSWYWSPVTLLRDAGAGVMIPDGPVRLTSSRVNVPSWTAALNWIVSTSKGCPTGPEGTRRVIHSPPAAASAEALAWAGVLACNKPNTITRLKIHGKNFVFIIYLQ